MAGALVGIVVSKLGDILNERLKLASEVSQELENLSSEFKAIQAVLHDAECRQISEESVRQWLAKLKAVAYDMEDVLDDSIMPILTSRSTSDGDDAGSSSGNAAVIVMNTFVPHLGDVARKGWKLLRKREDEGAEGGSLRKKARAICNMVVSWDDVAQRVKAIKLRLEQIAKEKNNYNLKENRFPSQGGRSTIDDFETSSMVDESKIIGREVDKWNVISWLVSGTNQHGGGIDVISVIGVGGLGKTTLARLISQDERVKQHFEKVLWVCVSDDFDVKKIIKAIIQDDRHHDSLPSDLNPLQKKLLETLQGKLFFLILDDIWNEDEEKWEKLILPLQKGARGSKILITTRSEKIATMMNATYMHKLEGLSDEDSWLLFASKAFGKQEVKNQPELEEIGKEIAKKCSGVPLSLKVMGSAMRLKSTVEDWHNIRESEMWALPEVKNGILPALVMSYNNLPAPLKQCFVFCSIFPKDYLIHKDALMSMWVAHGFIQPQGRRELEDIGEEYFNDLVARSMFQDLEKDTTCKMHDLLRDLAQFITKDESRIVKIGKVNENCSMNVRHMAVIVNSDDTSYFLPLLSSIEKLRTLLGYHFESLENGDFTGLLDAKFLRVLDLDSVYIEIEQLLKSISGLKHLRYLNLSGGWMDELPESISELNHLRYLNLSEAKIKKLPESIGELKNLRCLNLRSTGIQDLPESIGELKNLRYLNLSGTYIQDLPESISELKNLIDLNLYGTRIQKLPESLCLLSNLETLNLFICHKFRRLPRGMGKMKSLRHLKMESDSIECLPKGLGKLTSLKTLPVFILGGEEGCEFSEFKHLNALEGSLCIRKLGRLSSREEAEEAELWRKSHLNELHIGHRLEEEDLPENIISNDDVLEGLRPPHSNLRVLSIRNYAGLKLPTWLDDLPFSNLVRLTLSFFGNCTELPQGLGLLPALKILDLYHIASRRVSSEFYYGKKRYDGDGGGQSSGRVAFPKLEKLYFTCMEELEEWEGPMVTITSEANDNNEAKCLPELTRLRLVNLPKLTALPIWMWKLNALKSLLISDLKNLTLWDDGLGQLKALEFLRIENMPKLTSFPKGLGELKKLKRLGIDGLKELQYLPDLEFGELEALEFLLIERCDALASLPQGLQQLTNLRRLWVHGCPFLTERCKRDAGADWTKIAHIPYRRISTRATHFSVARKLMLGAYRRGQWTPYVCNWEFEEGKLYW